MSAQRGPDVVWPTTQTLLTSKKKWFWPNVGPMLLKPTNINNFNSAILHVGPTLAIYVVKATQ